MEKWKDNNFQINLACSTGTLFQIIGLWEERIGYSKRANKRVFLVKTRLRTTESICWVGLEEIQYRKGLFLLNGRGRAWTSPPSPATGMGIFSNIRLGHKDSEPYFICHSLALKCPWSGGSSNLETCLGSLRVLSLSKYGNGASSLSFSALGWNRQDFETLSFLFI